MKNNVDPTRFILTNHNSNPLNRKTITSSDLVPNHNHNHNQVLNSTDLNTNNNNKLINNITNELLEKDKELQKLKNKMELSDLKFLELSKEKETFKSNEYELHNLKSKLNEQYNVNKELKKLEEVVDTMKEESLLKKDTILSLKNIILKQKYEINNFKKVIDNTFENKKLKGILLKHDFEEKQINEIFIQNKITKDTSITRELIQQIIK